MTRPAFQDKLQVYSFYLTDIGPIEALALPILTPLFGFSAITAPEFNIETYDVNEGNWTYGKKVVKRATMGTMTLSRGATFVDSDFYRWIRTAITGDPEGFNSRSYGAAVGLATAGSSPEGAGIGAAIGALGGIFGFPRIGGPTYRRDMLLVQTFARGITPSVANALFTTLGVVGAAAAGSPLTAAAIGVGSALGAVENFERVPARAWQLKGCIPVRYKSGGDFDATSGEVSVMELDMEVDFIEEVSLAA